MDSDGDEEGDGNGNEGGRQAMATVTKRAMVTAMGMTVLGNEVGNGTCSKSNGDIDKGDWRATAMRAIATRVAGG